MKISYTISSEEEMLRLGKSLAGCLAPGAFLALHGDLGAGKTVLVRGIAGAYGISSIVSPTFTIVQEYEGADRPFYHFDAYRLADADELYAIGFSDYLASGGTICMEWAELVGDALPKDRIDITILGDGLDARHVTFTSTGMSSETELEQLIKLCPPCGQKQ